MTIDRWKDILSNIKDKFEITSHNNERLEDEGGVDVEIVEFVGPLGKMRLEFVSKPMIMDKKTIYSNRIGAETTVNYVYSETEKTNVLLAYKWDDDVNDWVEMEAAMFK